MASNPDQTLLEEDLQEGGEAPAAGAALRLLIFSPDTMATHPLPAAGEVVLGRGEGADVRVESPNISRRHARLRLGPPLQIEDLGSANGTRLRGMSLKKGDVAAVGLGEPIELGSVTVIVQRALESSGRGRPKRLWTHGYFEGRLEEECARAEETGGQFAVLRLRLEGTASPSVAQEVLATALRPSDVVAAYGPGEYELLLLGQDEATARSFQDRLSGELSSRGAPVTAGLAFYGRHGRDPDALLARACDALSGQSSPSDEGGSRIVVRDPQMQRLHELIGRVAQGSISVLLMGETGVGKEVFAEEIHRRSQRGKATFVKINCAALTETLLESELFGHEKGAFTGAVRSKPGLLETAQGGTVLLDEIGEMPLSTQVKLLRVIEQREVIRVGDVKARPIDVRFIAATNRDLEAESKRGTFRQDLFFRLNGISLVIPPLRERPSEIEGLVRLFLTQAAKLAGRSPEPQLSPEALDLLKRYAWPGNIRELRNVIERAVLLGNERVLGLEALPVEKLSATLLTERAAAGVRQSPPTEDVPTAPGRTGMSSYEVEKRRILDALERTGGNQTEAAKLLGISRRTMLNRLDSYAIPRPRKGK